MLAKGRRLERHESAYGTPKLKDASGFLKALERLSLRHACRKRRCGVSRVHRASADYTWRKAGDCRYRARPRGSQRCWSRLSATVEPPRTAKPCAVPSDGVAVRGFR